MTTLAYYAPADDLGAAERVRRAEGRAPDETGTYYGRQEFVFNYVDVPWSEKGPHVTFGAVEDMGNWAGPNIEAIRELSNDEQSWEIIEHIRIRQRIDAIVVNIPSGIDPNVVHHLKRAASLCTEYWAGGGYVEMWDAENTAPNGAQLASAATA